MVRKLLFLTLGLIIALQANEVVRLDCAGFVRQGLESDPRLREERFTRHAKEARIDQIKSSAILPRFEANLAFGPAPGLRRGVDNSGDTVDVLDFSKIGPYFGTEWKVAQPLNLGQLNTGLKAARADLEVRRMDIVGKTVGKSTELQEYYYGYLLALELLRLTNEAQHQMNRAHDKLEEALDEDEDGKISQMDLLEIKAGFYEIDKAVADADNGLRKAKLAVRFALSLPDSVDFVPSDTLLSQRPETLPSLDSLKVLLAGRHPDLRKLEAGLRAMDGQMELASAKLGPEFFVFGSFKYAKSWAGDRKTLNPNAFEEDPVNTIDGAVGLGVRYRLNFWDAAEGYRKARIDFRQLKMKESYAEQGILMLLEEQYDELTAWKAKLESVRKSLRATEAILKGAAIQYDVDPSKAEKLISAYKKNLLMKQDYYYAVYHYNLAFARVLGRMGWTLDDFSSKYMAVNNTLTQE